MPELRDLALASCAQVQRRDVLSKALHGLEPATLRRLVCRQLRWGGVGGRLLWGVKLRVPVLVTLPSVQ